MLTARSRAWFFPTSPRSPDILQAELRLLKGLDGQTWGPQAQYRFAELLAEHRRHSVNAFKDPHLSARDRVTRGPRLLGFVHLPRRGTSGALRFTSAGNQLLQLEDPAYLYQRQLAKVQFSSPLHCSRGFEAMQIRPMLAVINILQNVETLSKEEIALFVITTVHYSETDRTIKNIRTYRQELSRRSAGRERNAHRLASRELFIRQAYLDDISAGRTSIRETQGDHSLSGFIHTKYRNHIDYADATMRYLQSSNMFTVSPVTQRLMISNAHMKDAAYLLDAIGLAPVDYSALTYDDYIDGYLGNADVPTIRKDQEQFQKEDFNSIIQKIASYGIDTTHLVTAFKDAKSRNERIAALRNGEEELSKVNIREESRRITAQGVQGLSEIKEMFQAIADRQSEVVDRPLMYEWNTWRAMVLMNDALDVRGHFTVDADGNPLSTAPGGHADILIEYETFWLVVEVTLQRGHKQYESEGEPIVRHVGLLQKKLSESGDKRPVYAIFMAESINDTVVPYLQMQARFKQVIYGGAVKIVPMTRKCFEKMVETVVNADLFTSKNLKEYFDAAFSEAWLSRDGLEWYESISKHVEVFLQSPPDERSSSFV